MFEAKTNKPKYFSKNEIDQVRADRIGEVVDTGETYTTTDGEIVHVKRVIKA